MIARYFLDHFDSHRLILVVEDQPNTTQTTHFGLDPDATATTECLIGNSCSCDFSLLIQTPDEEVEAPHINGDLSYLYRRQFPRPPVQKRTNYRHPLRIPCWRAGRWKSLT